MSERQSKNYPSDPVLGKVSFLRSDLIERGWVAYSQNGSYDTELKYGLAWIKGHARFQQPHSEECERVIAKLEKDGWSKETYDAIIDLFDKLLGFYGARASG